MNIVSIKKGQEQVSANFNNFNSIATDLSSLAFRCAATDAACVNNEFLNTISEHLYSIANQVGWLLNTPLYLEQQYKKKLIFLACPFTADSELERDRNLAIALKASVWLIKKGFNVYNPLAHGTSLYAVFDDEMKKDYLPYFNWHEMNCRIMAACDAFVWLDRGEATCLSQGMQAELREAQRLGLPILGIRQSNDGFEFIHPDENKQPFFPITHIIED